VSAQPKIPPQLPANDPPQLKAMSWVAEEFGFRGTRAARDWCRRRGVPYSRDGKFNWVDVNLVRAAMARGPAVVVACPSPPPAVAAWADAILGGPRHGS
jgi:hypothetical protein